MKKQRRNSVIRRAPLVIYPYQIYSESARLLASNLRRTLGARVLRVRDVGNFKPRYNDRILNWGNTNVPGWKNVPYNQWFNHPIAVARSANKISTFDKLAEKGISCVRYTSNQNTVQNWLDQGRIVFARTIINSHGGRGIHVIRSGERIVTAPLFTLYQRKDQEFRIHVFRGKTIDVTEKRRSLEFEQSDNQKLIRNHENGWVFCHDGISIPQHALLLGLQTVQALELDFGAVDIISDHGTCYVLEVNTAPGIEGTTLNQYVIAITNEMHGNE